jgi:hypothetical protein
MAPSPIGEPVSGKMSMWMRFGQPLEVVMDDYERIFDGWQAGGVEAVVFGRLLFANDQGEAMKVPAFDPNPAIYRDLGVEPPEPPAEKQSDKRRRLEVALTDAKRRGLELYVFCPDSGQGPGGSGHPLADEQSLAARVARVRDVMEAFPMVDGGVLDGPELGYEIAPGHRSNIFQDMPETLRQPAADLGYDFDVLCAAQDRFEGKLHNLQPAEIELRAAGGFMGLFELFDSDAELAAWFAFRRALLSGYYRRQHEALSAQLSTGARIGVGSRLPCFTPLNGYDLRSMGELYPFILPKLYFYHRGFDGFYGTIGRYIQTLVQWNPSLSDAQAMKVVEGLLGVQLPWIQSRLDLDLGFPPVAFEEFVASETRRMLAAVPSPERVVPWVEAGREPHHGDPISAGDLHRYLGAAHDAGLQRFLYHSHTHLTPGEWTVLSNLCGEPWLDGAPGYAPPDDLPSESHAKRKTPGD